VICFSRVQYDSDLTYGHVGIVENVGQDGSITTGPARLGAPPASAVGRKTAPRIMTLYRHYARNGDILVA